VAKSWNTFIVPFEVSLMNSLGKLVNIYQHFCVHIKLFCFNIRTVNSKVFTSERFVVCYW